MTKRELHQLRRRIPRELPGAAVVGLQVGRVRGGATYALEVVDTRTGERFVVRNFADWNERLARRLAAELDIRPLESA
jgi:hypothetical protein